jgi:hypothetical protein
MEEPDMSRTAITSATQPAANKIKRRVPHNVYARLWGVVGRTVDRWEKAGRVPPADIVNKRKYRDPDVGPRLDD